MLRSLVNVRWLPTRTISGRVVLGFLLLMATFSGLSGYTLYAMNQLGGEVRFILSAYLEISVDVAKLQQLEDGLVDHLDSPALQRPRITWNRDQQKKLILAVAQKVKSLGAVPPGHRAAIDRMQDYVDSYSTAFRANGDLYELALAPDTAKSALAKLKQGEARVQQSLRRWFQALRGRMEYTTLQLERAEEQARYVAIVLGAIAGLVGLLVTVWAVLTLRPLRRLRDGVREVARGDYRQRLDVSDGTEVAEVAAEFNAMAAAIEEREQELVRSERLAAVGKMAAVITHEIRNPLSSIGLNAELLEDEIRRGAGGTEAGSLCKAIHKEVDRLTAITEEYLRFARLPRPRLERESVNDVVTGLVEFQREELELAGSRVELRLADGLPAVAADEAQLRQALLNLVRNAADAMGATGGVLTLATLRTEAGVEVHVRDTGGGIAPEHLPRIFEPFFSTKERGTGLGLALTQQIVVEHGGRLDVESASGQGTTFVVRLPVSA